MTTKTFDSFVKEQARAAKSEFFDKDKELADWRQHVAAFYETVMSFLKKYIDEGTIQYRYAPIMIHEEQLGSYELDGLTIFVGTVQIQFKPIGTILIGAKGRIDMAGPRGTVKFVLVDKDASAPKIGFRVWVDGQEPPPEKPRKPVHEWVWKIATPPPKIKYTELAAEAFQTALMEVANG